MTIFTPHASDQQRQDFAIIGGGSTGPTLLFYIAKKIKEGNLNARPLRLHLIDPNGFGSGGIAYGRASPNHYLNSTRDEMSPWEPLEFHNWCVNKGLGDNVQSFNHRSDNARFIEDKVKETLQFLRQSGVEIIEHKCEGYPNPTADGCYDIQDQNGRPFLTNLSPENFVLASGYGPNENLQSLHEYIGDGYVHDIYEPEQIAHLRDKKGQTRIVVAGTGPALYDVANVLPLTPDAQFLISTFSRAGKLLDVRDVSREPNEVSQRPTYLDGYSPKGVAGLKKLIKADFARAAKTGERTARRVALDLMRNLGGYLKTLDEDFAREFRNSSFLSRVKGKATPIPEHSQVRLDEFKPQQHKGYLNGNISRAGDGTFQVKTKDGAVVEADMIVNCTGHGRKNSRTAHFLLDQNLASIDSHLGILATDETGYRLVRSGIQVLGPAVHFGIDGVESFATPAEKIADNLIEKLKTSMSPKRVPSYSSFA